MSESTNGNLDVKNEYLYEMLQQIKQRPGMYLGKCSIIRLRAFIDGYMGARQDLGVPLTEQEKEFGNFQDWIQERYNITSSHGWDSIILFYSADERDALNKFFSLLEQFCSGESALLSQFWNENLSEIIPEPNN